ncbi:MAG: hypothetical protein ACOYXA_04295 [Bacteroidota bacterium]
MKTSSKFLFHEGELPAGYKPVPHQWLFNTASHREGQSATGWHSYYLLKEQSNHAWAEVHFCLLNQEALSPYKAPFGSFQFHGPLNMDQRFYFIQKVEQMLAAKGAKKIVVKNPPRFYSPTDLSSLEVMLFNRGYAAVQAEIGAGISTSSRRFEDGLHAWEKRKLKQARQAGLKSKHLPLSKQNEIYQFIAGCRQEKNQPLSMTGEELAGAIRRNASHFHLFANYKGKDIAAAAVAILTSHHVLYTFYYAHARPFDAVSPVVLLMQFIYQWAKKHRVQWIDLGTSHLDGEPNFPLLDFKLHLGAQPASKLTFEKVLKP